MVSNSTNPSTSPAPTTAVKSAVFQPMRKVVQLTSLSSEGAIFLYALCDDGTMWERMLDPRVHSYWRRMPDVPQD